MEEENTVKISKYNSGVAQIYRLDNLWKNTHSYARSGQFSKWNLELDRVWCELARDLKEADYKQELVKYDTVNKKLSKFGGFNDTPKPGFNTSSSVISKSRMAQYNVLMEKELLLRRLENQVGKGTAWEDEDNDMM